VPGTRAISNRDRVVFRACCEPAKILDTTEGVLGRSRSYPLPGAVTAVLVFRVNVRRVSSCGFRESARRNAPAGFGAGQGVPDGRQRTSEVRLSFDYQAPPARTYERGVVGAHVKSLHVESVHGVMRGPSNQRLPKRAPANSSAHAHAVQAARTARTRSAPHRHRDARRFDARERAS